MDAEERYYVDTRTLEKGKGENIIIPFAIALDLFQDLNIPIYYDFIGDWKCHFKDVCKKLTKKAMNKNGDFNHQGIDPK